MRNTKLGPSPLPWLHAWIVALVFSSAICAQNKLTSIDSIQPYFDNPSYWQYKGEAVLLLGGSIEDNLFQINDLEKQLDLLRSAGGNYVRCTMSSRDEGNVWPFARDPGNNLYDLTRPNPVYWERFSNFLSLTAERDIIVQIEVWATFDFYDGSEMRRPYWQQNPFNPKNNVNYTAEQSGLPTLVASHPTRTDNPFFWSIPAEHNNRIVLSHQEAFVDQLLSYALSWPHILYCMDNETSVTPHWGEYWSRYIQQKARQTDKQVYTTEMWDPWDLSHPMHSHTFDAIDVYNFVDISQNNHQKGQAHWDNAQKQRQRVQKSGQVRPLNNVKVYGADGGRFGDDRDGIERFWRNLMGGMASSRFHRPPSGLGLSPKAQASIRSARLLSLEMDLFRARASNELLRDREPNEAYCTAVVGKVYAIFFPDGGEVKLQLPPIRSDQVDIRWLDIANSQWLPSQQEEHAADGWTIRPPGQGFWVALVRLGQEE